MGDININFADAISDLIWLLDRDYPKKPALDLVGNRFMLDSDERMILYRGVFDSSSASQRERKRFDPIGVPVDPLLVDGYNVLITLEAYIAGKRVFRSLDGFVRDISGIYGKYAFGELAKRSAEHMVSYFKSLDPPTDIPPARRTQQARRTRQARPTRQGQGTRQSRPTRKGHGALKGQGTRKGPKVLVFLDYPVSRSGDLACFLREAFSEHRIRGEVRVVKSPDREIIHEYAGSPTSAVATSDTVIIDRVGRCVDIPDFIIKQVFRKEVLDLTSFLHGGSQKG